MRPASRSRAAIALAVASTRVARGWTQQHLARATGTTQSRIAELESTAGNPTLATIEHVAGALGLELALKQTRPRITVRAVARPLAVVRERSPVYGAGRRIIIIAGPNGAGKSTFAREYLPSEAACPVFVNADLIAAGLAPFAPETVSLRAGRLMLDEIKRHASRGTAFSFETTLAGRGYARFIAEWQSQGYRVELIFLRLRSVELAIARVALRVAQGGHDIPEPVIRRRFTQGLANFSRIYCPLVDAWRLYDNSGVRMELIEQSKPS